MMFDVVQVHELIIPTVLVPLTAISVLLSSIAIFIAGLFGLKLKAEGPKKLLEVLLKPRVIIAAVLMNVVIWGGVRGFYYVINASSLDVVVHLRQSLIQQPSELTYENALQNYTGHAQRASGSLQNFQLQTVWQLRLPEGAFSAPTISGDSIFVGSDDGFIYEVTFAEGKIIRRFYIGTEVSPSPLVFEGYLFSGEGSHDTHHARVSKFDLKTGEYVGSVRSIGHIEGQLNIDAGSMTQINGEAIHYEPQLYASAGVGGVYAIHPRTMELRWISNLGHTDSGARFDGDKVYYGTGREKSKVDKYRSWAVAVDRASGGVVWQREMPASSWLQPLVLKDRVCFVFGEIYFASEIGGLGCFDKSTGATKKFFYHTQPVVADPLFMNGDIYLTDLSGQVCRIDGESLSVKWCHGIKDKSKTYAGVRYHSMTDTLVQVTRKEGIYILNPDTGQVVAQWPEDRSQKIGSFAPVTFHSQDMIFIGSDGLLVRLKAVPPNKIQAQN